ncbi:type II toxin-antitoxin system RelE/ParE family toxin [Mitsuaria sp. 7]|uniref:type II toxin-antitoxin system RelE/ParE family toxin n=1 Tax=Mitsuaria sp. 7 TaxID=1658665 RepID=UPI0007DD0B32|nr:type II toxin-antitoxin system RelE/ParE family toxin [Mitsuaria sp. 7]ANH68676.1 hypothetical protein ABE85_15855 [Mitsuaria sp. 7]
MNAEISREAFRDLHDILSRIEEDDPIAAERMQKEFFRKFRILECQPGLGTRTLNKGVRALPVKRNYRVLYQSPPPRLIIRRVIHVARHWPEAALPGDADQ